jgi:hypothetical protein
MAYITQFYTWATGNTITAARLNGNVSNLIDGLDGGTKDINISLLQIGGNNVIDSSQNITNTGDITGTSSTASKPVWMIKNTNADANAGDLQFYKLSASPADNDDLGTISFYGDDDGTNKTLFSQILVESTDVTGGTEDGKMTIYTMTAGTSTATLTMESGAATFGGALTVTGAATFTGGTTFNGGITLGAGDDLIGSSTSDITFNTNKFTVAGATGNTVVAGTLGVTGVGTFTAESVHNGGLTDGTATLDGSGVWTGVASLTVDNVVVNGNDISSSSGNLTLTPVGGSSVVIDGGASFDGTVLTGLTALTSTAITGTLQTAAQTNITSVGVLTGLSVDGAVVFNESSADVDFRVESNNFTHALIVEGSSGFIGLNDSIPNTNISIVDNTATTNTGIRIDQQGTGDTIVGMIAGGVGWSFGIDQSDSEAFKISKASTNVATNNYFKIDTSGVVHFGTRSAIAAETVTGYITIKDIGGTSRKIAVVS